MANISPLLESIFRWLHVFVGVIWIGFLYFFNWVNGQFAATLDAETKRKVVPELLPRALFWFRWGAAWTWITGVLLLSLVFYHSRVVFDEGGTWSGATFLMIALTFFTFFIYDAFFKSPFAKNPFMGAVIAVAYITVLSYLMVKWAGFGYRGYSIHIASLFGTNMAANVWFRIWPAQQKIITAIKNGETPDANLAALAGLRSKHNTYMSLPLMWGMINSHTTWFSGGNFIPSQYNWLVMPLFIVIGWHIIQMCYKKAGKLKGF